MIHKLKIQPQYFANLISGAKKAEVRLNDRDFQMGDDLGFTQTTPGSDAPRTDYFTITHIHAGLGLQPNYVVLSLKHDRTLKEDS